MSDKIQIDYIYRNIKSGYFSIHKVFQPIEKCLSGEVTHLETPFYRADPLSVFLNMLWMFVHRRKNKVYHITGVMAYLILPLFGCPTVFTVHDLSIINNPAGKLKRKILRFWWFECPLKRVSRITCISETTRQELLMQFPEIPSEKVSLIYNPLDPSFVYSPKDFNAEKPVILQIGTTRNKNLHRLVQALKNISCHLVIIGRLRTEDLVVLKENNITYTNKVGITDEEMLQEYRQADIISFPSLYEGFGMPVIEGQATGRVVLTSRIQPLIEISGDAVCYVNPMDVDDIRQGFKKIISDRYFRESMISKGLENVQRFDIKKITDSYLQLYKKILG